MLRSIQALNHPTLLKVVAILAAAVFLVMLITTVIYPVPLGLADNHDYWRLMDPFGLSYPDDGTEHFYQYINLLFNKGSLWHDEIISSGIFFIGIAYFIVWILQLPMFPLVALGSIYIVFYTWGYYLFIRNLRQQYIFSVLIFAGIALLFFGDSLFTVYFNSFYQESAAFICLLFFIALFLSPRKHFVLEWIMIMGLCFSKISNISFVFLFVLLAIKYWYGAHRILKLLFIVLGITLIVLVQSSNQSEARSPNIFNSFFQGLVRDQEAQPILNDFNLTNPLYVSYIGKDFWHIAGFSETLQQDFFSKVNHGCIAIYYLEHPVIMLKKTMLLLRELILDPRPDNLGNRALDYSNNMIVERGVTSFWQRILPYILLPGLVFSFGQIFYLWWLMKRRKYFWQSEIALLVVLPFFLPLQLLTSFIGDGWNEFAKHNVTFYFVFMLWLLLSMQFWYKHFEAKTI